MPLLLLQAGALLWAICLCAEDLRHRRLPNALTLGGMAVFLLLHLLAGGGDALIGSFAAASLAGAFLFVPWLMRAAGGGDLKMLAAAGAAVGPSALLSLLLYTSVAGLAVGMAWLAFGRVDPARLRHLWRVLTDVRYDRQAGAAALPAREQPSVRVPFSLAIALGLAGAFWIPT